MTRIEQHETINLTGNILHSLDFEYVTTESWRSPSTPILEKNLRIDRSFYLDPCRPTCGCTAYSSAVYDWSGSWRSCLSRLVRDFAAVAAADRSDCVVAVAETAIAI